MVSKLFDHVALERFMHRLNQIHFKPGCKVFDESGEASGSERKIPGDSARTLRVRWSGGLGEEKSRKTPSLTGETRLAINPKGG
jgi:hypothetical protein